MLGRKLAGRALDIALPAEAHSVPDARLAVCKLAREHGAAEHELERVALAVSEAVTNAVVHAYGEGPPGSIALTAVVAGRQLTVLVADDGCGMGAAAQSTGLGLGLGILEHACDTLTLGEHSSGGMLVEMWFQLSGAPEAQPQAARASASQVRGPVAPAQVRGSVASATCAA